MTWRSHQLDRTKAKLLVPIGFKYCWPQIKVSFRKYVSCTPNITPIILWFLRNMITQMICLWTKMSVHHILIKNYCLPFWWLILDINKCISMFIFYLSFITISGKMSNAYSNIPHHLLQTNFNQWFRLFEFPWDFIDKISEMGNLIELIDGGSSPTASHEISQNCDTLTKSHVLDFACNNIFEEPLDFVLLAGGHSWRGSNTNDRR